MEQIRQQIWSTVKDDTFAGGAEHTGVAMIVKCFFAAIEGDQSRCQDMKAHTLLKQWLCTMYNEPTGGAGFRPMSWRPTMRADAHETQVSHTVCITGVLRRALGARLSSAESSQSM